MVDVRSPLQGTVVRVAVEVGTVVQPSTTVLVVESMKMEYTVEAGTAGTVGEVKATAGDAVQAGDVLMVVAPADLAAPSAVDRLDAVAAAEPDAGTSPAYDEVVERHRLTTDAARPDAVERRRRTGHRTARENVADLCDQGSFVEYGPLVIAAQRRRRELQDLIERTPADGLVAGVGQVDGRPTAVMSYDYTVLAGTQGCRTTARRTDCSRSSSGNGCRSSSSPREAAAARGTPTLSACPASTAWPSSCGAASAGWCRRWGSRRGGASPGTL